MDYMSVKQFAEKYGVSERTVRNYCGEFKVIRHRVTDLKTEQQR